MINGTGKTENDTLLIVIHVYTFSFFVFSVLFPPFYKYHSLIILRMALALVTATSA